MLWVRMLGEVELLVFGFWIKFTFVPKSIGLGVSQSAHSAFETLTQEI